jgi:hypothetical protein
MPLEHRLPEVKYPVVGFPSFWNNSRQIEGNHQMVLEWVNHDEWMGECTNGMGQS